MYRGSGTSNGNLKTGSRFPKVPGVLGTRIAASVACFRPDCESLEVRFPSVPIGSQTDSPYRFPQVPTVYKTGNREPGRRWRKENDSPHPAPALLTPSLPPSPSCLPPTRSRPLPGPARHRDADTGRLPRVFPAAGLLGPRVTATRTSQGAPCPWHKRTPLRTFAYSVIPRGIPSGPRDTTGKTKRFK